MHSQKPDLDHSTAFLMLETDWAVPFQTNGSILRNFENRWVQATKMQAPILDEIARAAELLSQLRLYELPIRPLYE